MKFPLDVKSLRFDLWMTLKMRDLGKKSNKQDAWRVLYSDRQFCMGNYKITYFYKRVTRARCLETWRGKYIDFVPDISVYRKLCCCAHFSNIDYWGIPKNEQEKEDCKNWLGKIQTTYSKDA